MIDRDFDAVIFDCDGTLVDSEPITVQVLVDYVGEYGLSIEYAEALALFVGRDMPGIVDVLETRLGSSLPLEFCEQFRTRQAVALRRDLKVIDGAHDLLRSMSKPFCVASNAPQDKILINLTTTGLAEFLSPDRTFSAYDINAWKPRPDLFHYAAKKLGVSASRCVVIEDSEAGIEAGLAAGAQVIGYSASPECAPNDKVPFVHALKDLMLVLSCR